MAIPTSNKPDAEFRYTVIATETKGNGLTWTGTRKYYRTEAEAIEVAKEIINQNAAKKPHIAVTRITSIVAPVEVPIIVTKF